MMIRPWKVWSAASVAIFVVAVAIIYSRHPRDLPKNVLLVTLDTTRADHLGCYGYEQALTPVVDQLSREGVTFENAFCSMPLTLPSHASILTGRYPPENGVHENGNARLDENIPTVTQYLRHAGYSTAAFIASMVLDSKHGLDQAFDVYDDNMAGGRRHGAEAHLMRDGNQVVDAGLRWLHGVEGKPFFCWIHLYDAHAPFEGYADLFGDRFRDHPYDGDIAFADVQVGRLVDDLKQRGLYDNTIIVIVGDHGEGLGEHSEEEHGFMLYNSTLRVPLIVKAADLSKPGHRIRESVSVVDILPTILECLGIPLTDEVGGESVAAALRGTPMESHDCYSESIAGFSSFGWAPLTSIITESWKYVETTRSELYDLKSDPAELQNLAERDTQSFERMQRKLQEVQDRMIHFTGGQLEVSESDRRKLESIGYVSGGKGPVATDPAVMLPDVKDMMPHYNSEVNARKLIAAGSVQEAIDLMTSVSREVPLFIPARLTLGAAYEAADLPMEAADVYEDTIRANPDSADAHFAVAKLAADQGDMPTAIAHYTRVVEIDPRYATAHFNLGSALFASGDPEAAKVHYEAGLAEFPDSLVGQFNYGVLLAHQNKPEEAIKYLDRAALFSPDNPQIIFQQGLVLSSLERYAEAAIRFESVLRLNPQYSAAAEKLEEMYRKMSGPE